MHPKVRKTLKQFLYSFINLKRNIWMSLISITSTTVMLTLVGLFSFILISIGDLTSDIENNVTITTFLSTSTNDNSEFIKDKDGNKVQNKDYQSIYKSIKKLKSVKSISWSSKDAELQKLISTAGDTWSTLDGESNPLYDVYLIKVKKPSQLKKTAEKIKAIVGVADVEYGGQMTDKLVVISKQTKLWGTIGITILVIVAAFLISNTIKITIMARKDEIEIMRLVGAPNYYIRLPFLFEGLWLGLLGSILPILILGYGYNIFYATYNDVFAEQFLSLIKPGMLVWQVGLLVTLLGVIMGMSSSVFSMRRYLKI